MFIFKNDSSRTISHSKRNVNEIKLQIESESSLKKAKCVKTPKRSGGKKVVQELTQSNKQFLEQLGFTLKK